MILRLRVDPVQRDLMETVHKRLTEAQRLLQTGGRLLLPLASQL